MGYGLPGPQSTSLTRALKAIYLVANAGWGWAMLKMLQAATRIERAGNYKFNAFSIIAGACACRSGDESVMISGRQRTLGR